MTKSTTKARSKPKPARLTPRLRRALLALHRWIEDHGEAPMVSELATAMDIKTVTAQAAISDLKRQGFIERSGAHRDITITTQGNKAIQA